MRTVCAEWVVVLHLHARLKSWMNRSTNSVKTYLITTGTIFGLIAVLHLMRGIAERDMLSTAPGSFLAMAGLGLLAAGLSLWAWWLLRSFRRQVSHFGGSWAFEEQVENCWRLCEDICLMSGKTAHCILGRIVSYGR